MTGPPVSPHPRSPPRSLFVPMCTPHRVPVTRPRCDKTRFQPADTGSERQRHAGLPRAKGWVEAALCEAAHFVGQKRLRSGLGVVKAPASTVGLGTGHQL